MIFEQRAIAHEGETLELDPFAFWPDLKSRLMGLGGSAPAEDPDYAFHTLYAACGSGPIVFTVAIPGLQAERGTLILRVHELPEVMGASAREVAISQTQLLELMRSDGEITLPGEARAGSSYALLGHIYGDTVATADTLLVAVARRTPDPDDPAMPTRFRSGDARVGAVAQLVGQAEGTLKAPVSQLCTRRQVGEPAYRNWAKHVGSPVSPPSLEVWERAYILRVLDRYDVSRPGAQGLGIGGLGDALADAIAVTGPRLTLTTPGEPPSDAPLPGGAVVRRLDPHEVDGLEGFDFAYATRAGGVGATDRQAVLRFVEDVLRTLKPGGLAVVVTDIDVRPLPIGESGGPLIRRPDIDRIALLLISRGHQVAQLLPFGEAVAVDEGAGAPLVSAFGLIVRRAA